MAQPVPPDEMETGIVMICLPRNCPFSTTHDPLGGLVITLMEDAPKRQECIDLIRDYMKSKYPDQSYYIIGEPER